MIRKLWPWLIFSAFLVFTAVAVATMDSWEWIVPYIDPPTPGRDPR